MGRGHWKEWLRIALSESFSQEKGELIWQTWPGAKAMVVIGVGHSESPVPVHSPCVDPVEDMVIAESENEKF